MPFVDNRENSPAGQDSTTRPPHLSGMLMPRSSTELQPFSPQSTPAEGIMPVVPPPFPMSPHTAHTLIDPSAQPDVTRQLDPYTGPLLPSSCTNPLRQPVLIRGSGKKDGPPPKRSIRRHLLLQLIVAGLLVCIVLGTSIAVTPTNGQAGAFGFFPPALSSIMTRGSNTAHLSQQAATATAVLRNDGYDPGPVSGSSGGGGLDRFYYGQCTYWANMRYHELTGIWLPWLGNANQWTAGAYQYQWNVSASPHVPSIIVLQGGVQGASGYYGHVAIVESINADGSVHTSGWNWNGRPAYTSYVDFKPGPGVSFVWAPNH